MKQKFILILAFFIALSFKAQVGKFTAVALASKYRSGTTWSEWSKFEPVDMLVSINIDEKKIKIYSQETQIYDIIEINGKEIDDDGDESFRMFCEDKKGLNCHVDLFILKSQYNRMQIYIRYNDMQWVYNLVR